MANVTATMAQLARRGNDPMFFVHRHDLSADIPRERLFGASVEIETSPHVAIVSMCDYDGETTSLTAYSMASKHAYCRRHGYKCFLHTRVVGLEGRPSAWGKVLLMRRHLGAARWLMWMDCDSFFTNSSVPLEAVLARAGVLGPPHDPYPRQGWGHAPHISFLTSEDAPLINTGIFFLRDTPIARSLLDMTWGIGRPSAFVKHSWWEQAAIFYHLTLGPHAERFSRASLMLPQEAINGYPPEMATNAFDRRGRVLHAIWQPGDLIISFSGCRILSDTGQNRCNELFRTFDWLSRDS